MSNSVEQRMEKPMLIDDDDDDDDIVLVEDDATVTTTTGSMSSKNNSNSSSNPSTVKSNAAPTQGGNAQSHLHSSQARADMIGDINSYIDQLKTVSKKAESEITLMRRSIKSMESSLEDAVYEKLKFLVDNPSSLVTIPVDKNGLEAMIQDVVKEVLTADLVNFTALEMRSLERRLEGIETANQVVSKMYLECHSKLKTVGLSLAEESKRVNEEIARYESILSVKTINIDDDDDDDVKIVEETSAPSAQPVPATPDSSSSLEGLSINQLRSRFASVVQTQMPGLLNTLNTQQAQAASNLPSFMSTPSPSPSTSSSSKPNQKENSTALLANLLAGTQQSDKAVTWPTLLLNDRVMGKKFNDVWYEGNVLDIYPPSPPQEPELRFKVRFNKGMKVLPGKHVAYKETLKCMVKVGTRVIALYREEDAPNTMYAGIIAEAPSIKNNKRFLVFFDDGYAQYCHATEVHKVYMQSENVWEDIHPETRSFIKDYLDIYPERPMVRLGKGQVVKTEWNGKWWTAKVMELDASLVKMVFQADRRTEWIYRGSTRLEPLFRALTNANAIKAAGSSRGRRHNLNMRPSDAHRRPAVEYTRGTSVDDDVSSSTTSNKGKDKEDSGKAVSTRTARLAAAAAEAERRRKYNVARKSTGGLTNQPTKNLVPNKWEAPWIKYQRKAGGAAATSGQRQNGASAAGGQDKGRSAKASQSKHAEAALESLNKSQDIASVLQERLAHSTDQVEYDEHVETGKRRDITIDTAGINRTPFISHQCCSSCLGNKEEVLDDPQKMKGTSPLLIPLMCLWERQVCKARPNPRRYIIYRGPCGRRLRSLAEVDRYLQLTNSNLGIDLFSFDQNLHVSREFVPIKTFCDIKDLSYGIENYPISCVNGVDRHYPDYVEYYNYRIPAKGVNLNLSPDFLACCDCTDNCRDRSKCACQQLTTQNTSCIGPVDQEAGYHYRKLRDSLFTGIFECNANCPCDKRCHNKVAQLGLRMRLQVFRTEKKGWGLRCLDDIAKGSFICIYAGQLLTDKGANEDGKQYGDEYLAELDFMEVVEGQKEGYESDVEFSDEEAAAGGEGAAKDSEDSDYSSGANFTSGGDERRTSLRRKIKDKPKPSSKETDKSKTNKSAPAPKAGSSVENSGSPISISDDEDDNKKKEDEVDGEKGGKTDKKEEEDKVTPMETDQGNKPGSSDVRRRAKKSTGGSRLNLSYSAVHKSSEPEESEKSKKPERLPTRSYFHDDTECYIMDAKSMGNLGRYLNHSCTPNVFVQNVFVDTHDLRFPWVAFFAGEYIRAGTELTWDYNYEVGSVPDKILYCYCGSSMCRGRLL